MSEVFGNIGLESGGEYELTRDNSRLYKHLGHTVFDHLFVNLDENRAFYIWRHHESFEDLERAAINARVPMHLNIPEVSPVDASQYLAEVADDMKSMDSFPDEWV